MGSDVVGAGEGAGAREAGEREGVDAGFCAACDHDGGVAEGDEARGVADGVGACGASRGDGVVWAEEGVAHGDVARGEVDEEFGDEEGRDFFVALD